MYHFIMRKRQNKVFGKGIPDTEYQLRMMVFPVNRILGKIGQRVVHPAHIPFLPESQTTGIRRARYHRPGSGFLCEGLGIGIIAIDCGIQITQKSNGIQIFPSPKLIGNPFAVFATVIQVEHRCYRIDAQSIDMIFIQPEQGAADKKRTHFMSAVIENRTMPLRVVPLTRISMLKQKRTVEMSQAMCIVRKMRGHPVENDADTLLVQCVHQKHEILRCAITGCRRKITGSLVAP